MSENTLIKLNPYLARSKNLIEFFIIVGYKEEDLIESCPKILKNKHLNLSIISIITAISPINNINMNIILENTYPDKPSIIQVTKSEIRPKTSCIIFSSCINYTREEDQTVIKSFYSCFSYRFYEKFIDNESNQEYYVPKAFLIISEYPYFSTFYKLCNNIYQNCIEVQDNIQKNKKNINKEYYLIDNIPIEIFIHTFVNYIPSPLKNSIIINLFANNDDLITIPMLTGYPYIDFDLYKIINLIPINEFIKIYILMFLEIPLFFFSKNLELLNLFMYSLYILNYPLTNSMYFWHINSISKDKISLQDDPNVIIRFFGINSDYNKELNLSNFDGFNYALDLDNKKVIKINLGDNDSEKIQKLLDYINNILSNNKNEIKSYFLSHSISLLKTKLEIAKNKYKNKSISNFFYIDNNIIEVNNLIQEAFYDFILYILIIKNKEYQINNNCSSIIHISDYKTDNYSQEEQNFLKFFKDNDKFNCYYNNFIRAFDSFDEYRISLLFCDEFVQLRKYDKTDYIPLKISYFEIIKNFYSSKSEDLEINYDDLYGEYKEAKNKKAITKNIKTKKRQLFYLDKNIVNLFLYNKKNKENLFTSLKAKEKYEIKIPSENPLFITLTIKNHLDRYLSIPVFIRSSLVYVFSIIFPFFPFQTIIFYLANLLDIINKNKFFQRYYISTILKSITKYYLINQKFSVFSELNLENIKNIGGIIKDNLNENNIIPNEEIFILLKNLINEDINKIENNYQNIINKNGQNNFVFEYDKISNYVTKINYDVVSKEENTLIFKFKGKKEEYDVIPDDFIYFRIYSIYDNYYSKMNFNIEKLEIDEIIDIIINIIYFLLLPENEDKSSAIFLFKTVIVLHKLKNDIKTYKEKKN